VSDERIIPIRKPVVIGEAGGMVDACQVTLALYAEDLDPDAVTRMLGAQPTHAHRRGERRSERSPPHKQGAWLLTVKGTAPTGPDELMHLLFERLPAEREFWKQLCDSYTVKISVGVFQEEWNRGFDLRAETVALLARTGAAIDFDLYLSEAGE
jgi:hypothetical protein